jgi:hypothetical protein
LILLSEHNVDLTFRPQSWPCCQMLMIKPPLIDILRLYVFGGILSNFAMSQGMYRTVCIRRSTTAYLNHGSMALAARCLTNSTHANKGDKLYLISICSVAYGSYRGEPDAKLGKLGLCILLLLIS